MSNKEIIVSISLDGEDKRVGKLWCHIRGNRESASFIDFYDSSASIDTALSVAKDFKLDKEQALSIIKEVRTEVRKWREVAYGFGISKRECDRMSSAFVCD